MELSDKIRILRKARGFSQENLGYNLSRVNSDGISRQTISDWENGKCEPILENIRDLAKVLNVSFDSLLDESIDLNDEKTLINVLKNLSEEKKAKVNSKFRYAILKYNFSKKDAGVFVAELISVSVLILSFVFATPFRSWSDVVWILLVSSDAVLCVSLFITGLIKIVEFIRGCPGAPIGELNNTFLIINTVHETNNTLYIPVEKIESMVAIGKNTNRHGSVEVSISGRARKITIINVYNPNGLILIFNKLQSFNENPDEIKIL